MNPIKSYLRRKDWRLKENANRIFAWGGLKSFISEREIANYALREIYPEELSNLHRDGSFHIHDLSSLVGYCAGHSLQTLLSEGFNGVGSTVQSKPAKHFRSALGQLMNFLGVLQQEWAGAQAVNSFDTLLAPYVQADHLSYGEVKQSIQEFIYNINVPLRFGMEVPFTNISWDLVPPTDLKDQYVIWNGGIGKDKYSDFQDEMNLINRAFLDVMYEGDAHGNPFPFPIPTYRITKRFSFDGEVGEALSKLTAKFGSPYFENLIGSDLEEGSSRSMCCHLKLDLNELRKRTGGIFGSGDCTGSVQVVTINLNRIGIMADYEDEYFHALNYMLDKAREVLQIKRKYVTEVFELGLMPYTKRYLPSFDNHFSTIGVLGGNECCLNFLGEDIASVAGKNLMIETLKYIRDKLTVFQKEDNVLYNLEETPSESASYRLAKLDIEHCKKFQYDTSFGVTDGLKTAPFLNNSTHLPVDKTEDIWMALRHQEELQQYYTGGTVFHTMIGSYIPPKIIESLVTKISTNSKVPYFTITPTFSICPKCQWISGEYETCPKCGAPCQIYSRVVGYYRPISAWNDGKAQEFKQRKMYNI